MQTGRSAEKFPRPRACAAGSRSVTYNHMVVDLRDAGQEAEIDRVFGALADATRRDILRRSVRGELSVSALATDYAMSFAAVQKHVAVLERAGLINKRASGRQQLVSANPERLQRASELLDHFEAIWRQRMAQLDDLLSENPKGK